MKLQKVIPLGHVRADQKTNDGETLLSYMVETGFVPLNDADALSIVESAFDAVKTVFPDEVRKLPFLCLAVYDMDMQPQKSDFYGADAMAYFHTNDAGKRLYCIAVSLQGIRDSSSFLYFLLLHELAHLMIADKTENHELPHSELFEAVLNELIDRFNDEMGTDLKNDYSEYAGNENEQ